MRKYQVYRDRLLNKFTLRKLKSFLIFNIKSIYISLIVILMINLLG